MDKIKFQTNIGQELALKFPDGKECESQFGPAQWMFTTTDDRVFFVDQKVAQKIHGLRLQVGECFDIVKAEVPYGNNRKGIEWQVKRVNPPVGEQRDGTFVVPGNGGAADTTPPVKASGSDTKTPTTNGNGSKPNGANGNGNARTANWAGILLTQTNTLVDVYAQALASASAKHGNQVKPEDVRSLMTTAFINLSKGVSHV